MATGYVRLAHESIPGNEVNTPTLSTKKLFPRLIEFEPNLNPAPLLRDDESLNTDEPTSAMPESYDPAWRMRHRMYPDAIGFNLTCGLGLPTTTAGNGVITDPDSIPIPTGATKHVWTAPFGPTGASPMTFQAEPSYKDQSVFFKAKGCATSEITIESPETGGCMVNTSGPACWLDDVTDPALTPTYESDSIPPFMRSTLTLPTWLAGTAQFRDFDIAINIPNEPRHTAGSGSKYADIVYKGESPIVVTGSIPKELLDLDDWNALVATTGFAAKARWTNTAIIAASYPYKVFVEFSNAQYVEGGPEALSNRRRIGASFDFRATRSGSASCTITVVNATTSYA